MLKSLVFLWYFYLNPWSIEYRLWEELWIACCLFLWPMMSCYITFPPLLHSKQPQSVSNILVFPALTDLCFSYLLSFVIFFPVTNPNLFGLASKPQSVSNILVFIAFTYVSLFSYLLSLVMFFSDTNPNPFVQATPISLQ